MKNYIRLDPDDNVVTATRALEVGADAFGLELLTTAKALKGDVGVCAPSQ